MRYSKICALLMLFISAIHAGACSQKPVSPGPLPAAPPPTYQQNEPGLVCLSAVEVAEIEAAFEASSKKLVILGKPTQDEKRHSLFLPVMVSLGGGFVLGVLAVVLGGWALGQIGP